MCLHCFSVGPEVVYGLQLYILLNLVCASRGDSWETADAHSCLSLLSFREHNGLVVECLAQDRRVAGSSLTSSTAFCP